MYLIIHEDFSIYKRENLDDATLKAYKAYKDGFCEIIDITDPQSPSVYGQYNDSDDWIAIPSIS